MNVSEITPEARAQARALAPLTDEEAERIAALLSLAAKR